jgi:GT2 family glycosyltransferase
LKPLPKVAIVILTWNGRKFLEQFLPSVVHSTYSNHEIIVVDNNSADDSIDFLKTHHATIRIIQNPGNWGFAKGYNEALKNVSADYYVLLNSDVEVTASWLEPMVELLESDTSIAACQPKILSYHNKKLFEYAGAAGGWIDKYGYPFCKGRVFEICEEDHGQYDQVEPIFWATGAALFIRSSAFHQQKGLDEYFFAHQEEIDLCWRIQLAGGKIYSCPSSVVYHVGGGTLQRGNSKKTFLNFRNNLIMLAKNWPSKKIWTLPVRISLDAMAAWRGLLTGDAGYFWAIVKAHFAFFNWLLFHQTKSLFPLSRKGYLEGVIPKNLVWQFFIKKRKTFSKIVNKT